MISSKESFLFILSFVIATAASTANAADLKVGDIICTEGFVMDFFCINRGRMIDNNLPTLEQPDRHSVHCLIDVGSCIGSPFELLLDPMAGSGDSLYRRGWRFTEDAKAKVVDLAKDVGSCGDCVNGNDPSKQVFGFRVVLNATVVDLNEGAGDPPLIEVNDLAHSNDVDDPCNAIFGMMDVTAALGPNSTLFPTGSQSDDLRTKHLAHGCLMLVAWGFLLPLGAMAARFLKHRDTVWFRIHKVCQVAGLLLAISGWVIALRNFNVLADIGYNNYRHGICGMVTMVLGLLQPLNAVIRPHPPKEGEVKATARIVWEVLHKGSGYTALLLAVATIALGTTILPEPDDQTAFQIAYGAGCIGTLFFVSILMVRDRKNTITTNVKSTEDTRDDLHI